MAKIRPLIGTLEQAVREAIASDDVTREDAVAAWGIAITKLDQDGAWHE